VQDAENLAWKLAAVVQGRVTGGAAEALLDSYGSEREYAADENLLNSTRATDFITPKSEVSRLFRDAVLELAKTQPFARRIVNSGRLSVPATLATSALNTPDTDAFRGAMVPGAVASDAPLGAMPDDGWLLRRLGGEFTLLVFGDAPAWAADVAPGLRVVTVPENATCAWQRYDAQPGTAYLIRPDQHVAARWRRPAADAVRTALSHAYAEA
jgi:3-(3-hydroxy-phenyl)propionate hydroxylase